MVHADAPEEAEARREAVDREPGGEAGPDVLEPVGERIGQLESAGAPASCMWYPLTEIGLKRGIRSAQNAITSETIRIDGEGG